MGQLSSIIAAMKTAIALKTTARDDTTTFADATAQHNLHPGAEGAPNVPPGEARFYVHEDEDRHPEPLDRLAPRQWFRSWVVVLLAQQTGNTEANEAGYMDTNIGRVIHAVETAATYPSNSYPPIARETKKERNMGLFLTRITFSVEYSEAYA